MSDARDDSFDAAYARVVARAWNDEAYRARLLNDPVSTLRAAGVAIPQGTAVNVLEDSDRLMHLVIPARPAELSEQELDKVSGGAVGNDTNCTNRNIMRRP